MSLATIMTSLRDLKKADPIGTAFFKNKYVGFYFNLLTLAFNLVFF